VNRSAQPAKKADVVGLSIDDLLIADVLRRAHRTADERNSPNEARAILHVAQAFADELGIANPRFDRLGFIRAATDAPS
jgi:hypothetical protein